MTFADLDWKVPTTIEFCEADDIHVKAIRFDEEMPSIGEQHMHTYEHVSVVLGPFRVFIGNAGGIPDNARSYDIGGKGQPFTMRIEAHKYHRFISLKAGGILLCITNRHGTQGQVIEKFAAAPKG